jgi:hypothetical protein
MLKCATPAISINTNGVATVTCATPGATLRYTMGLDPTDPEAWTTDGEHCTTDNTCGTLASGGTLTVPSGQTLKVIADCPGYSPSAVFSALYGTVAQPTITADNDTRAVTITASSSNIRYTTDGTTPTATSSAFESSFNNAAGKTIKAISIVSGVASDVTTLNPVGEVTISMENITANEADVTFTCATPGATIRYTTDENEPSTTVGNTATNETAIHLTTTNINYIKAYAYKEGLNPSATVTKGIPPMAPTFSVNNDTRKVTISCATEGAVISYKIKDVWDGWQTSYITYTGDIDNSDGKQIRAVAAKFGENSNEVTLGAVSYPTSAFTNQTASTIEITFENDATEGSTTRYTTDGTLPTTTNGTIPPVNTPITLNTSQVEIVKYYTYMTGGDVISPSKTIEKGIPPENVTFSVDNDTREVTLSCATTGVTIYYTIDNTTPYTTDHIYLSPINKPGKPIKAKARKNSAWSPSVTTIPTVATPTIDVSGATATISCTTEGATIYYTTNGDTPTTASTPIASGGTITLTGTGSHTVKAYAVMTDGSMNPSADATATVTVE